MRSFLLLVILLSTFIFPDPTPAAAQAKHAVKHKKNTASSGAANDEYYVPNISAAKIGTVGTRLPDPFSNEIALKRLFPRGRWLKENEHHKAGIVWRAHGLSGKLLVNSYTEETDYFPAEEGNHTNVSSRLPYTDGNGQKWILLVLQSTDARLAVTDELICRPQGADMSLALFRKDDSGWVLTNCTIQTGYYGGTWGLLAEAELQKFGSNNYGIAISTSYRGAGGPDGGDISFYGLLNGQYKKVLHIKQIAFGDAPCNAWYTWVDRADSGALFDGLKAVTRGWYNRRGLYHPASGDDTVIVLPDAFNPHAVPTQDSFRYHITTQYIFEGDHYILKDKKVLVRTRNLPPSAEDVY